jgi:hypothetical protein
MDVSGIARRSNASGFSGANDITEKHVGMSQLGLSARPNVNKPDHPRLST